MRSIVFIVLILFIFSGCTPNSETRITSIPESALNPTVVPSQEATFSPTATTTPLSVGEMSVPNNMSLLPTATATITPVNLELPAGTSRDIARATDMALAPTPRNRLEFSQDPVQITFEEFYDGYSIRRGLLLSDKLVSLDGQKVMMEGYMAPPLKPELDWFILTRIHLSFCPFCSTVADWPNDIALVYLTGGQTTLVIEKPVRVTGILEVGQSRDAETGMISLVRLYIDSLEVIE